MVEKTLIQIDSETGEQLEGFAVYVTPKRRNGFGQRWLAMSQDAALLLAQNESLGRDDFRVLLGLLARLDFENLLVVNQAELAREINMRRQHVQRSIKRLLGLGALLEGPKIGRSRTYRLNPAFGWKGSAKSHHEALRDRMARVGLRVIDGGGQQPAGDAHLQRPLPLE